MTGEIRGGPIQLAQNLRTLLRGSFMAQFYYFEKDGRCDVIRRTIQRNFRKYFGPEPESDTTYYLNMEWSSFAGKGADRGFLEKNGIPYVERIDDLPPGGGLYVTAYDGDITKIEELGARGVPVMNDVCPWMIVLKRELAKVGSTHQCVLMLDRTHMVFENYRSLFPPGTILVNDTDYRERLKNLRPGVPVHFTAYSTFRPRDAERVMAHIEWVHPHADNVFHTKGICGWITRSGLFEEVAEAIHEKNLTQVWVIASNPGNRSVISLRKEIEENGASFLAIQSAEHVPATVDEDARVGILLAPIPFGLEKQLLALIRERFSIQEEKDLSVTVL